MEGKTTVSSSGTSRRRSIGFRKVSRRGGLSTARHPRAFARSPCTLAPHVLLENLRQPSHPRPRSFRIGEHEVDLAESVASVLERQHPQLAGRDLLADLLLRVPGEAEAHARGLERRRHVADGPALLGLEKAAALVALDARVAHDQVAVLAKVLEREPTAELEQRMIRMSGRHEGEAHHGLTAEPR